MASLKEHKITKIATGSSHSIAYSQGSPETTTAEFSPVTFLTQQDPLGASLITVKPDEIKEMVDKKRPTLTKIILSLNNQPKQQEALGHVLTALQIAYARDTIVNALGGVVMASAQEKDVEAEAQSPIELTSAGLLPMGRGRSFSCGSTGSANEGKRITDLDEFASLLTVEDARIMVDLLKLAVSGRVGEKGKESLSAILTTMGKANPEVGAAPC